MQRLVLFLNALLLLGAAMLVLSSTGQHDLAQPAAAQRANLSASAPNSAPAATPTCAPSWQVVATQDVSEEGNDLFGVDAVSSADVWAVGAYSTEGTSIRKHAEKYRPGTLPGAHSPTQYGPYIQHTLIEHW